MEGKKWEWKGREATGMEGNGREVTRWNGRNGMEGKERKMERKDKEREGNGRNGTGRTGTERAWEGTGWLKGNERAWKENV